MKRVLLPALAAALIFGVLVLPNHPGTMTLSALNRWPLELPVLLMLMVAVGRYRGVTWGVALVLLVTVFIKLADYAMFSAYNRTFTPILDTFLIRSGLSLLRDSIGATMAGAAVILSVVLMGVLFIALQRSLGIWAHLNVSKA